MADPTLRVHAVMGEIELYNLGLDYLERYPAGYTCHYVRPDWKLPHRSADRR